MESVLFLFFSVVHDLTIWVDADACPKVIRDVKEFEGTCYVVSIQVTD